MGKIVDRGREFRGAFQDPEGEIGTILTWKIWYKMDSGQRYSMTIDIPVPRPSDHPPNWTDEELKAWADRFNAENRAQLDRAQENFERMGPSWKLPREGPWDPEKKEHRPGGERVSELKEEIAQLRVAIADCYEKYWPAHEEYHKRESHGRPGGAGTCRAESHPGTDLPDCSILERRLAVLEEELARAEGATPPSP